MINLRLLRLLIDELLKIDGNKNILVMSNTADAEDEDYDITYEAQEFDSIKISDLLVLIKRFSVSNINIIWNFTDPKWYNEIMIWFDVWDNGDESITLFFY